MSIDIVERCPHLAALIGEEDLRGIVTRTNRPEHPLHAICRWEDEARDQYLAALDRAAELMESILHRSHATCRTQLVGHFRARELHESAVSELIWGARLERLGATPVMESEQNGQRPDFVCELEGERFFVEIYTPGSKPEETLIDDIHELLKDCSIECSIMLHTGLLKRHPENAKAIARRLRTALSAVQDSSANEATFYMPHGATFDGWITEVGAIEIRWPVGQDPVVHGTIRMDGIPGFRFGGSAGNNIFNPEGDARREIRRLGQLQKGAKNVLLVDLTAKASLLPYSLEKYEAVAQQKCLIHPELAAVIFSYRFFPLQPAPGTQHELKSLHRVVGSTNPDGTHLPESVLEALQTPALLVGAPRK